ncbi:MAG TPA: DUF4038 domain-containing protein [Myxococcota bacterium]|nr:DUF4038 domain-containing protein [Myxococcota bacterium]
MRTPSPRYALPQRSRVRLAFALGCLLLLSAGARAGSTAFVQKAQEEIESGNVAEAAFRRANGDGNLIVAYVVWDNSGVVTLSDSQGNDYEPAGDSAQGVPGSAQVFFARNVRAGKNTVSASFASPVTTHAALYVHEYARMSRLAPFDLTVSTVGVTPNVETGLLEPHTSADLLFLAITSDGKSIKQLTRGYKTRVKAGGTVTADSFAESGQSSQQAVALQSGSGWIAQLVSFHYGGSAPKGSAKYPLQVGSSNRYLVDQSGTPFLITGDSPQALIVNVSQSDAASYLSDRQKRGFNAVWVNLLCATFTGGRENGSTFDGVLPFNSYLDPVTPDLTQPNPDYFARVDEIVRMAAERGLLLILDPAETGSYLRVLQANGPDAVRAYGAYLGTRYRGFDNILWMSGNDFHTDPGSGDDQLVQALAAAIRQQSPGQLQTVELNPRVSNSLDDESWRPFIDFNASYSYTPPYAEVLEAYDDDNPLATFLVEGSYEGESLAVGDDAVRVVRSQVYWSLLSGAMGHLYGHHYTWQFISDWQNRYKTEGSSQMGIARRFFESHPWWQLVPDRNHALVTNGFGNFTNQESGDNDYVTAGRTPDGKLGMAYVPQGQTITVDLSQMAGKVSASWFDPAGNRSVKAKGSPFSNSGAADLTPPGKNRDGDPDWVLVLESP